MATVTGQQMMRQQIVTTTTGGQVYSGPIPNGSWVISQSPAPGGAQCPPFVSKHIEPQAAQPGGTAKFEAHFTGNPTPKVAWLKDGQPLAPSAKHAMAYANNVATLTISHLDANDVGNYFVVGENQFGRLQSGANLLFPKMNQVVNVNVIGGGGMPQQQQQQQVTTTTTTTWMQSTFAPLIVGAPSLVQGLASQSVTIVLHCLGNPQPTVTWFKDGKHLQNGPKHQIKAGPDGVFTLMINNLGPADGGQYTAQCANPAGQNSGTVNLNVLGAPPAPAGPPYFTEVFSNMWLDPAHPAPIVLHCKVGPDCKGPITFTWLKDNVPQAPGKPYRIVSKPFETTLYIDHPKPADVGTYTCTATGPGGAKSHPGTVQLKVTEPKKLPAQRPRPAQEQPPPGGRKIPMGVGEIPVDPRDMELVRLRHVEEEKTPEQIQKEKEYGLPQFMDRPQDLNLVEGNKAHFECRYGPALDPTLSVIWTFGGKEINASSRIHMSAELGRAVLDINGVYPEDTGLYTCQATNAKGQAQVEASLSVKDDSGVVSSSLFGGASAGSQSVDALERRLADPVKRDENVGRPNWAVQRH